MGTDYYAHSSPKDLQLPSPEGWQGLADHLREVAKLAREHAKNASPNEPNLTETAYTAGLLHDLGKYRSGFQDYLHELKSKGDPLTLHKQAGAKKAIDASLNPVAFAVFGHHGGLPDKTELLAGLKDDAADYLPIWNDAVRDCPGLSSLSSAQPILRHPLQADLLTRVLFSCLVDADWADTGEHQRRVRKLPQEPDPPPLETGERYKRVEKYIAERADRPLEPTIKKARADVLTACINKAEQPPGLFSLTVPTGGGKTLASLAFALKHAEKYMLRRVIYVAPYMTILEQNADVIRAALGVGPSDPFVFEHYSLAEPPADPNPNNDREEDSEETRLSSAARRAENWEAPFIITTNVQFFESLFSNKPGRCRKIHNIARSVIILDECQTLPPGLAGPTCGMLKQLTTDLGCTVVLCTATQPAFDHPSLKDDERLTATEIIPEIMRQGDEHDLFVRLKRVKVSWPKQGEGLDWPDVAALMVKEKSALCVVNTKKAARSVFEELKKTDAVGVFHLSTGMCPAHRMEKLASIRRLLTLKAPCYVVSTQLIEAGVDVDFPFLMRELAPLESIIQAAGRCNREGRIKDPGGRVVVFRSAKGKMPPDEWYNKGRSILETDFLNDGYEPRIDSPTDIRSYYRKLFRSGRLDKHSIQAKRLEEKFATVGADYRLIRDDTVPVLVTKWESHRAEIESLLAELEIRPRKAVYRALARFQINFYRHDLGSLQLHLEELSKDFRVWKSRYDEEVGIVEEIAENAIV